MELLPQSLSNYITRKNPEDELYLDMMKDSAGSVALIFLAVTGSASCTYSLYCSWAYTFLFFVA